MFVQRAEGAATEVAVLMSETQRSAYAPKHGNSPDRQAGYRDALADLVGWS